MSIETLANVLDFLDVDKGYFKITAANDVIKLAYDSGSVTSVDITDGTYEGSGLATTLTTVIDAALSCSSTVTYSTTTKKFTLDAGSGHTFAYTHSGSDAGLTIGFDQDHSAARTVTSDIAANDPSGIISNIQGAVEDWIESYCRRVFESASYREVYSGNGTCFLNVDQYPVTEIIHLAIGTTDAIKITNSTAASASVSVITTGLVLTVDGVADSTVTFADNSTLTDVVTAVDALGSGWDAALMNSLYGTILSNELIEQYGKSIVNRSGDNQWVYLQMSADGEEDYKVYPSRGQINLPSGFSSGDNNVFVNYTAGYSTTTMPEDLKLAVKIIVKRIYQSRQEEIFGVNAYEAGDWNIELDTNNMPRESISILSKYRRWLV